MPCRRWTTFVSHSVVPACLIALTGCSAGGPHAITSGRLSYAEAITVTGDEQVLRAIVFQRFNQRLTPMAVQGVTANYRWRTDANVNLGIGPNSNFAGNLVPLSGGVAYEENPIISYAPVDSATYLNQLLAPIPLDTALLVMRSTSGRQLVSMMMLERINGLKNPTRRRAGDTAESFAEAIGIISDFFAFDLAEWVALGDDRFGLLLQVGEIREFDRSRDLVRLMALLELSDLLRELTSTGRLPSGRITGADDMGSTPTPTPDTTERRSDDDDAEKSSDSSLAGADADAVSRSEQEILVIPVRFSAVSDGSSIALTTRSVYDLFRIAAMAIEQPSNGDDETTTTSLEGNGPAHRLITIRCSSERPKDASVMTFYREKWYYIDSADTSSQVYFNALSTLWSAQIDSAKSGSAAPLLTVPVGG